MCSCGYSQAITWTKAVNHVWKMSDCHATDNLSTSYIADTSRSMAHLWCLLHASCRTSSTKLHKTYQEGRSIFEASVLAFLTSSGPHSRPKFGFPTNSGPRSTKALPVRQLDGRSVYAGSLSPGFARDKRQRSGHSNSDKCISCDSGR